MTAPATLSTVVLITTGGTIATETDPRTGRSRPSLDGRHVAAMAGQAARLEVRELSAVPSWTLGPPDIEHLARETSRLAARSDCAGVVLTTGTSTLEYAAYATDLCHTADVPVVFTGAMRTADAPQPDGPGNLADAISVALDDGARGRGVLVVFHGRILSARGAWKRHRTDVDAFVDVDGAVGSVTEEAIEFTRAPARRPMLPPGLEPRAAIVKAYPGADDVLVDAAVARGIRGLVVEGLPGSGGIPPAMLPGLARATHAGVLVVASSRAPWGGIPDPPTGGTGAPLRDLPLVGSGNLTAEKAWVLLMAVLAAEPDVRAAADLFREVVAAR